MKWLQRFSHEMNYLLGRLPEEPGHLCLGRQGERAACDYLCRQGYSIVANRWQARGIPGDIDLIARQGELLCIVEVKTRSRHDQAPPEVAVDRHKRETLRRLAHAYLRRLPNLMPPSVRFDIVSVYLIEGQKPEIRHIESAFGWQERWMH